MPDRNHTTPLDPSSWVDDHGDALYRYAYLRLRDESVAEELVQEALLAALGAKDRFAGQSSERTWLLGILKHKLIDHLRRRAPEQSTADFAELETEGENFFDRRRVWNKYPRPWRGSPEQALEDKEFWDVFHRCFAGLPQRLADVFALREMDEMETDSICDLLSISATNLWTMLHRARLRLRECLEGRWFVRKKERR